MLERITASLPSLAPAEQRVAELVLQDARAFARLAGARAGGARGREQAHRGALLPQHGLRRAGRLQAEAGRQRQRGRTLHPPQRGRGRQDRRRAGQGGGQRRGGFLQYRNAASSGAIERAVDAIAATWKTGHRIEIYGVGNSGIVAQDAQHKFFRLGVTSISTSDGHMQVM